MSQEITLPPIKYNKGDKYLHILRLFDFGFPYNTMRNRELEVYAILVDLWHQYKNFPKAERNRLIFDYDSRIKISEKLGISTKVVYNIMKDMRHKGIIDYDTMIDKYIIPDVDKITFVFEKNELDISK